MVINRILTAMALLLATITIAPHRAAAAETTSKTFEYNGLTFKTASDGSNTASLTGGTVENGQLIIPATVTYEGTEYTVNAIAWWSFDMCDDIVSVVMPDCITSVGSSAFALCSSLETVTWSKGLKSIGDYAFCQCYALKSAILPEGLQRIGACAFQYCTALTEVSLPQTLTQIATGAFSRCDNLISIDIPGGVAEISEMMVSGENLKHIGLHEGLKRIERMGIFSCTITELRLPFSLESLAETALFNCICRGGVYAPWPRPFPIGHNALDSNEIHVPVNTSSYYHETKGWETYELIEDPSLGAYYTYSISDSENGTIRLMQDGLDIKKNYFSNASPITIILEPDEGYELKSFTVNGQDLTESVIDNTYTITTPDCNITVEAVFGLPKYVWLTIRQGIGGETRLKTERYEAVELAFNTDPDWHIHSVTLNDVDLSKQLETAENLLTLPPLEDSAVLNIAFEEDASGSHEVAASSKMHVSSHDGTIYVTNLGTDATVSIYTTDSQRIAILKESQGKATLTGIQNGLYIVTDGTTTVKIAL